MSLKYTYCHASSQASPRLPRRQLLLLLRTYPWWQITVETEMRWMGECIEPYGHWRGGCTCKQDSAIKEHTIRRRRGGAHVWNGRIFIFSSSLRKDGNGSPSGNVLLWIHEAASTSCNTIVTLPSLPSPGGWKLQMLPSWGQCNTFGLAMRNAVLGWRGYSYWLAFIYMLQPCSSLA